MRKQKAALLLAALLLAAGGCGNKTEQLVEPVVESVTEPEDNAGSAEDGSGEEAGGEAAGENDSGSENPGKEAAGENNSGNENPDEGQNTPAGEDSFEGVVREINEKDNFVVVSKIFKEEMEDGGQAAVIFVGEGAGEEDLITVYFTENTTFKIKTVKNGGEEVTEKEGAFSDIRKESTLEFKGKMDAKGEEFLADETVIYEFI